MRLPGRRPRIVGLEHLVDGKNSVVFERAEGVGGIVEALHRLRDQELRRDITEGAQREAREKWTSAAMADAYLHVYEDALARAERVPRHRLYDSLARTAWRGALTVRPGLHRLRRLVQR